MEEPVRSQARLDQTKRLSNAILRRTVVNVVLFIVVYLVLFAGFMTTLGSAVSNFVYELLGYDYALHTLASNLFLVLTAIGFVAGIVLVVRSGINRALRYFDLLLDSVSDILAKSDGPVMLPGELAPTAMALNTIKATSEQNERAAKAAEDRKNELVVYLAHDIKTPLTSIIGYLTLLEESPDLPLEVRERYTGITLDKAYRLEELLDEFFEITRYNLQTIPIERSRFDAALFVNQVVDEFFPLAEGRRLNLVYEGPAELSVFADAGRVARVLNNVIKNAVAYADPGTDVRVRTGLVTAADGFVWWELTVSDQGRELSPQHLERIFEKFYREDRARSSKKGGAGLGLAIAREIVVAHHGDIEAASERGVTVFTLRIPTQGEEIEGAAAAPRIPGATEGVQRPVEPVPPRTVRPASTRATSAPPSATTRRGSSARPIPQRPVGERTQAPRQGTSPLNPRNARHGQVPARKTVRDNDATPRRRGLSR